MKSVPISETGIQVLISNELLSRQQYAVLPNVSWSLFSHEADIVAITKSNYLYEYEIKVSLSDFKNDFKKRKHKIIKQYLGRDLKTYRRYPGIPNYFSYVAPENCYPICLPSYAGVFVVEKNRYGASEMVEVKKPVKLHGVKAGDDDIKNLLRILMLKYWDVIRNVSNRSLEKEIWNNQT